ncbi:DivIVA domain-containing protein [Hymenobacter sp. 15J16-1T3B]|uniref:DivIVA domain-containing protein n=1 Tax=Hymenobacter sp. 15J16-1T3B TaxID=2886941 RepID=UPI001D122190|nr:DivIVA domain-containing protein [Hymenobacter sp. 15J16-1T3B]
MNFDFSALELYDDMLVHVCDIVVTRDYKSFATYLSDQDEVDAFTARVIKSYQAVRLEIKNNLDRIPDQSTRLAYLKEVERFLSQHPNFHAIIERGGAKALLALTHKPENGPPRDFALRSMRALLQRKADNLTSNELEWLTNLHVMTCGAHETWTELKEELNRQFRLNSSSSASEGSTGVETQNNAAGVSFDDLWTAPALTKQVD